MNNKLEVIGIDHGWSMMKTIFQVFVTGVKEITTSPALFGDVLEYEGKFYKVGTVRQEVKDTKVEDDSFYLLTLAAVAKELKRRGLAEAKVFLAVGLPLTRFGAEKNDFIKYLTKNKRVKADNQTEKQTESVKPTEEVEMATKAVTEVTTEVGSEETEKDIAEVKDSEEKIDKEDNRSADNETDSKQEEKPKQNDEPEQKAPVNDNEEAGGNQSNAGNGGQTTDSPKDNVSNPQPVSVAYSPQNVVSLATAKCQAGGMITTQQNLQNHLNDGSITQEEYNEYYPYDGMEGSYYSVFVETDLNKASTIDGQRLSSEDAIAEYIASMLLLETDPVFYISYDGVYTTGGTDYYEFRCHR